MVTLEVVARDRKGQTVTGLTANDFQVFEETMGRKREKSQQKIAAFRPVSVAELVTKDKDRFAVPAGVYTNLVSMHDQPVPPTILLVDGINTELKDQMRMHAQMLRMLRSLPKDVPAAVFLLGHRLTLLQGFTTDPSLLKTALEKASTGVGNSMVQADPHDAADATSAFMEKIVANDPNMNNDGLMAAAAEAIQRFEKETYASNMDMRVHESVDALMAIARNVAGYPGRKNLLWISSGFPIVLNPEMGIVGGTQNANARSSAPSQGNPGSDKNSFIGMRNYGAEMREVANALESAKVAVYPILVGGVETETFFEAGSRARSRVADTGATAIREMGSIDREAQTRDDIQDNAEELAAQTGGCTCFENNDLGDCVRRAVNDSSDFYEISYYPTSTDWTGEFRKVTVKTSRSGVHLSYRQGYYAQPEGMNDAKAVTQQLQQAACHDYLNSTSILVMARPVPAESADQSRFYVVIDAAMLTFVPGPDDTRELHLNVGVCTFDKNGNPLQLLNQPIESKLTAQDYQKLIQAHGFVHVVTIPGPKPAGVRLVVQDIPSGLVGSVNMPVLTETASAATAAKGTSSAAGAPQVPKGQ
jgi:VWFA-related protein